MKKKPFKISLNWYGETLTFHRYARTEDHAMFLATMELARLLGRYHKAVYNYFNGSKDNYLVEEVKDAK